MSKRSRKTSPAKSPAQDHAGLAAWANIAVVGNKFQNPYWPNLLEQCQAKRITSEANYWLMPIMGSMQDLFGKIVWQPTLVNYLRRVHEMPNGEALALPLNDLAGLLWQDACDNAGARGAPPAVQVEIEKGLDAYMGDWKKSLLDHLADAPPLPPEGAAAAAPAPALEAPDQMVTLLQMSCSVNKSKAALEKIKGKLPPPKIKGGDGKASEWLWSDVRPILAEYFDRPGLPEVWPADRFRRR